MSLIIDERTKLLFEKEGISNDTSFAFAHLFAFIQGKTNLESPFREKFEELGIIDPENNLHMEDIESDMEWLLLAMVYEGKLRRKFDENDKTFKYQNTDVGEAEAIKLIKQLSTQENDKVKDAVRKAVKKK